MFMSTKNINITDVYCSLKFPLLIIGHLVEADKMRLSLELLKQNQLNSKLLTQSVAQSPEVSTLSIKKLNGL